MTWIKPAVVWGHHYQGVMGYEVGLSRKTQENCWGKETVLRVAIVTLTLARKAGLMRRPK